MIKMTREEFVNVVLDQVRGESAEKIIEAFDAMVIRCKECKYAHMTYSGQCKYCDVWNEDGGDALYLHGDFHCAFGERKDKE